MARRRDSEILTPREWEVLALIREGLSNEQIAERLGISVDGVKFHVSEILSRLGVRDRLEAARWRPEEERRVWALLLLAKRPSWLSPIVAAGLGVATAVGVGLLVWGLVVTSERKHEAVAGSASGRGSVMLFDLSSGKATRLGMPGDIFYAQWLQEGETIVAYDADDAAWKIFDAKGHVLQTVVSMYPAVAGGLVNRVDPSPDGRTILYQRLDDLNFHAYIVATGETRDFSLPGAINQDPHYSPNGPAITYVNERPDGVSLIVSNADGSNARAIRSIAGSGHNIGVQAWSPDGEAVLAWVDKRYEVIDLQGNVAWSDSFTRLSDVQWAGPHRLLVLQPGVTDEKGTPLAARAWFIDVASGSTSPAPVSWADSAFCCLSTSPDGTHAIVRTWRPLDPEVANNYNGIAPGNARCALMNAGTSADVTGVLSNQDDVNTTFCTFVDWTADGRLALASQGGH